MQMCLCLSVELKCERNLEQYFSLCSVLGIICYTFASVWDTSKWETYFRILCSNTCQNKYMCWVFPGIIHALILVVLGKRREAWVYAGDIFSPVDSAAAGWSDDCESEIPTEECRTQCYSQNEDCSKGTQKNWHSYPWTHIITFLT